jgi:hypothetical protein
VNPTPSPSPEPTVLLLTPTTWDVLGTIFQIAAIIVGAYFAYRAFIKKREEYPRATIKQSISHLVLPDNGYYYALRSRSPIRGWC